MVRNITLSADDSLIEQARRRARNEGRELNQVFREWLARYVKGSTGGRDYAGVMKRLSYARPGRRFSRDELNER